ncbi:hypothetical protein PA598K_03324 [Paenibacillus sp. 598K]|uniref:hypothetical protein n=1 Tax=Paenibacillus sp. 598K TaxID=1117987 RepID=UPI000FFA3CB4|nr:hypothetical protein [Paenibacillus sp. 598K]GBF74951.1 hypothetical protein PA598K_03324 [Paenibacillus sp. 598K]
MNFDESQWPIVAVEMGQTFTAEIVDAYIRAWERLLARQQRFGLLIVQKADNAERPDKTVTAAYMNWCKSHKEQIGQYCAGIAVVLPTPRMLLLYKPVTAIPTRKVYGCAGQAFATAEDGLSWLQRMLPDELQRSADARTGG